MLKRVYLDVPKTEYELVSNMGAYWDNIARKYYVPIGVERAPFRKWIPMRVAFEDRLALAREKHASRSR